MSTLSQQDSPAKTSALQLLERAWKESEADCFSRSFAWPKKSSPLFYSLRTCQQSPAEGENESLVKLPNWGMIVDGVLYPLHPLEHLTNVKGFSYLPTPKASDAHRGAASPSQRKRDSPDLTTKLNVMYQTHGRKVHPHFLEWMMGFPIGWTELTF